MKKERIKTGFVVLGIFGSVIAGVTLFIVGGKTQNFNMSIIGIVVLVAGIMLTSFFAILPYIIDAVRNVKSESSLSANEETSIKESLQSKLNASRNKVKSERNDVSSLTEREDFLVSELKRTGNESLLQEYQLQADALWDEYTGEAWDETLEAISDLVDYYLQFIK